MRCPVLSSAWRSTTSASRATPSSSNTYYDWTLGHLFLVVPSQAYIVKFIETFKTFPPRQKPASFGIDQSLDTLQRTAGGQ